MRDEVETLYSEIQEQRVAYETQLQKKREEKSQFEENLRVKYLAYVEEIESLSQKL